MVDPGPPRPCSVPSPRGAMWVPARIERPRGEGMQGEWGTEKPEHFFGIASFFTTTRDPTPLHPLAPCGSVQCGPSIGSTGRGDRVIGVFVVLFAAAICRRFLRRVDSSAPSSGLRPPSPPLSRRRRVSIGGAPLTAGHGRSHPASFPDRATDDTRVVTLNGAAKAAHESRSPHTPRRA